MIYDEINEEINEIVRLINKAEVEDDDGDHMVIMCAIKQKVEQIRVLSREQHVLLNARLTVTASTSSTTPSYADILKKSVSTNGKPLSSSHFNQPYTVLVKSSKPCCDSKATLQELKKKIDPSKIGVQIGRIRNSARGTIAISVSNKNSATLLQQAISEHEEFECKEAKKNHPYLRVLNVPSEVKTEEILSAICAESDKTNCRVAFQNRVKGTDSRHVAIQLSPRYWHQLTQKGYLSVSWHRLKIISFVPVQRCYKCQSFGHNSTKCNHTKTICPWCSGLHQLKDCVSTSETGKCINCVRNNSAYKTSFDTKHPTNSTQCKVFLLHKQRMTNSTTYESNDEY